MGVKVETRLGRTPPPGQNAWQITPEIDKYAREVTLRIHRAREERKKVLVPCPVHGTPSSLDRIEGIYMGSIWVYKCPENKGHEFKKR